MQLCLMLGSKLLHTGTCRSPGAYLHYNDPSTVTARINLEVHLVACVHQGSQVKAEGRCDLSWQHMLTMGFKIRTADTQKALVEDLGTGVVVLALGV